MTRLFISIPDPLPESLDELVWLMPGAGQSDAQQGRAADAAALPKADEIWLVLPAGRVLLTHLTLSRRALRQLNGALGNALEDRLMFDPTQVHVALGKSLSDDVHAVAAVDSAWLEQVLALCRRHDLEPGGAIPETLLWRADAEAGHWAALWRGQDGFVRSGDCAGFALDDGTSAMPPLALQLALAESRRQSATSGTPPESIVLEASAEVDAEAWSRSLACPVSLQTLRLDPLPPTINLLQGAYAPRRRGAGWLANFTGAEHVARYRVAAGLLAAAFGVHVLGTLADWARLSHENSQLRAEMRQVFKETFPQTQAIVDPSLQMQRQLADLRRARGYAEPGDFLHAVGAIAGQVGGVNGLSFESNRLTLAQPRATDLDGLRKALVARGYQMSAQGEAGEQTVSLERSAR